MATLLEDVQLTLENDSRWHRWCMSSTNNNLQASEAHFKHTCAHFYAPARGLADTHLNYLRRYFKWRYLTDQTTPPPEYGDDFVVDIKTNSFKPAIPPTFPPTEKPVMSSKLTFKSIFYLNGVTIDEQSKTFVFEAIATEEKRLEKLREIKHQPKSLVAEIEAGEAALKALIEHLDAN